MSPIHRIVISLLIALPIAARTFESATVYRQSVLRPNSVVVADFNGDGRDDVAATDYFCSSGGCELMLFFQTAARRLAAPVTYPAMDEGKAIQAGHFNADDRLDIAVVSRSGLHVYLQQPDGAFDVETTYAVPGGGGGHDLAAGDINRDGRVDLVAMTWGGQQMHVFEQLLLGGFTRKSYPIGGYGYDDFDLGDLNGDGLLDAVNVSGQGFRGVLHVNYGDPANGFGDVVEMTLPWNEIFQSVEIADLNGDGRTDLALISRGSSSPPFLGLLLQNADGTFTAAPTLPSNPWPDTLLAQDFDRDGDVDLAVTGEQAFVNGGIRNVIHVWIQKEPGFFEDDLYVLPVPSNFATHDHVAVGDVDDDGRTDLVVGIDNGAVLVYEGVASNRFRAVRH